MSGKKSKKRGIKAFFKKKEKEEVMSIGTPYAYKQNFHVGFDSATGQFQGLPPEWSAMLKVSGISAEEAEENPDEVMKVLAFQSNLMGLNKTNAAPPPVPSAPPPIPDEAPPENRGTRRGRGRGRGRGKGMETTPPPVATSPAVAPPPIAPPPVDSPDTAPPPVATPDDISPPISDTISTDTPVTPVLPPPPKPITDQDLPNFVNEMAPPPPTSIPPPIAEDVESEPEPVPEPTKVQPPPPSTDKPKPPPPSTGRPKPPPPSGGPKPPPQIGRAHV